MDMVVPIRMVTIVKEILVILLERMVPIDVDIRVHSKEPSFGDYSYLNKVHSEIIMVLPDLLYNVLVVVSIVIGTIVDTSVFIGIHMDLPLDIVDLGIVHEMLRKLLGNEAAQTVAKDGEPMPFEKREDVLLFKVDCSIVHEVPLQSQPNWEDSSGVVPHEAVVEDESMLDIYLAV